MVERGQKQLWGNRVVNLTGGRDISPVCTGVISEMLSKMWGYCTGRNVKETIPLELKGGGETVARAQRWVTLHGGGDVSKAKEMT